MRILAAIVSTFGLACQLEEMLKRLKNVRIYKALKKRGETGGEAQLGFRQKTSLLFEEREELLLQG
jgi:hypothetical protein